MDHIAQQDSRYKDLVTEKNEDGELVSFVFMHQKSKGDLLRLREIIKLWVRICYGNPSGAKFVGKDGLNAVTVVTPGMDKKLGPNYAGHVEQYRKYLQKNDLSIALGMTDVEGDKSLRPSKQGPHKGYYVRIVEVRKDRLVVRGAKAHIIELRKSNAIVRVKKEAILIAGCMRVRGVEKQLSDRSPLPVRPSARSEYLDDRWLRCF